MFRRISLLSFVMGSLLQMGGCQGDIDESLKGNSGFQLQNKTSCPLYVWGKSGDGNFKVNGIQRDGGPQNNAVMCPGDSFPVEHTTTGGKRSGILSLRVKPVGSATKDSDGNSVPGCDIDDAGTVDSCFLDLGSDLDSNRCNGVKNCITVTGNVTCPADETAKKACPNWTPVSSSKTIALAVSNYSSKNIYVAATSQANGSVFYNNGQSILGGFDPSNYLGTNNSSAFSITTKEIQFSGSILFATSVGGTTNCSLGLSALGTDKQEIICTDTSLCARLQPCNGGSCALNIYDKSACQ